MTNLENLKHDLQKLASPNRAQHSQRFFKTAPGQYGHGDIFIGPTVPDCRKVAIKYSSLSLPEITSLLSSPIHEERLIALLILVRQYTKGNQQTKNTIYNFYLSHTRFVNNWDLVDLSAPKIVGEYLLDKSIDILLKLTTSKSLWERRIAILSTFTFIYQGNPKPTLQIAEILLHDKEDLIHKAVGWMLREIGKRCGQKPLTDFLDKHYKVMPRTMLRYSIERFPESLRRKYLEGKV